MQKSHIKAYASAIQSAALSRTVALQYELAVGFAVQLETTSKRLARATLQEIYAQAGYQCDKPGALDWKSVNRRITASLAFFDFIGREDVEAWANGQRPKELVETIVRKLEPHKVKTVNEVLLICDKVKKPVPRAPQQPVRGKHIDTPHLHIVIPKKATRQELMEAATQMLALAAMMGTPEPFVQPSQAAPAKGAELETA